MIRCPHCGAANQPTERYCSVCSLELKSLPTAVEKPSSKPMLVVIIVLLIAAALAIVCWLLAAMAASGMSDK